MAKIIINNFKQSSLGAKRENTKNGENRKK